MAPATVFDMAQVLIVDDDESARLVVASILETAGHGSVFATSPEEALQTLVRNNLDVVVTDLHMPVGSGLDLIQSITTLHPDVPIIAMSGSEGPTTLLLAADLGASATLAKPVSASDLLTAVEEAIRSASLSD